MTVPVAKPARLRPERDYAQVLVLALIVLSVAASVSLVFADNLPILKLGLIAALWAAVLGALVSAKHRRESVTAAVKANDLRTVYELELEREVAARREYELTVENQIRAHVENQIRSNSARELAELREELKALRESLSGLLGGELLVERVALHAESTRLRTLSDAARSAVAATGSGSGLGGEYRIVTGSPDGSRNSYEQHSYEQVEYTHEFPQTDPAPNDVLTPAIALAPEATDIAVPEAAVEPAPIVPVAPEPVRTPAEPEPEPVPQPDPPRSGRRAKPESLPSPVPETSGDEVRSGAHSAGRSVSDLLAELSTASGSPGAVGRRHRRSGDSA